MSGAAFVRGDRVVVRIDGRSAWHDRDGEVIEVMQTRYGHVGAETKFDYRVRIGIAQLWFAEKELARS